MKEKSSQHFFLLLCADCGEQKNYFIFFIHSLKLEEARCGESKKKIITEVGKLFSSSEIQHKKKKQIERIKSNVGMKQELYTTMLFNGETKYKKAKELFVYIKVFVIWE